MPNVFVISKFQDNPYPHAVEVDTTSHGQFKDLSPFYLGPLIDPYYGDKCLNFENYWQYSKVYATHFDEAIGVVPEYWQWRAAGFNNPRAVRYPMRKGAVPIGSLCGHKIIGYVEARKRIYAPHYTGLVMATKSYSLLYKWMWEENRDLVLRDFDGYDHQALNMSLWQVINNPKRKMGHAFVLAGMLTGQLSKMLE